MNHIHEPGARWLRCDLHVHTPFDSQTRFGEDIKHAIEAFKKERPQRLAEIATRFIDACRQAAGGEGVDLVALTDHNSIEGYRYLKPQFDTIKQQARDEGLPMPVVLPGVEFSVGGERPLHFLVIFAAHTSADDIEGAIRHVFGAKEPFNPKAGTPEATRASVDEFLKRLYDWCRPTTGDRHLSFVVLPAHADSRRGIGQETRAGELSVATSIWDEMRGRLRQWVMTRRDWNGFQTSQSYQKLPKPFQDLLARWVAARRDVDWDTLPEQERRGIREAEHWPLIEVSDPHSYEAVGTRFTWLKMEARDVEGIRLALLDPESRLRRMSDGRPRQTYPVIRRIAIRKTDFFEEVDVPFNPCLNTLIGGRGSGKSTVIECLRHALDRARTDDFEEDEEEIHEAVERFLSRKRDRDFGETAGMLLPEHEVEIELEVATRTYRVTRSERGVEVIVNPGGEEERLAPLDVRTLITPRILSQRQIARIARDPAAQRRELDAMAEPEFMSGFSDRQRNLLERIEGHQATRRSLKERAATLPARETELQTVRDQITFLEIGGNKEILNRYQAYQGEQRWLEKALETLEETAGRLEAEASESELTGERLGSPPEGPTTDWVQTVSERVKGRLSETKATLQSLAVTLRTLQQEVEAERETKWFPGFQEAAQAYQDLQRIMQEKGVEFRQHEQLLQRRALLERNVAELRGLTGQQERIEREIREMWSEFVQLREERLAVRRDLASSLETQDADVRLEILPFGDRKDFVGRREEWFGGAGLQERDWEVLVEFVCSQDGAVPDRLLALVSALRQDMEATHERGRALDASESAISALLGGRVNRLTGHFFNALERGDRIQIDAMERFLPEDWVSARVRDVHGTFKPIEQGSIGLKSTAVLSLLLSAGDQPLVIDQPEDDLDNQYVYDVVVDLLRKRKFSRQIIIATHNANIPVNGDAEMIVVLGVEDRLGKVLEQGSIDRPEVKDAVSKIMEGSAEAFRLRRERYGY